VIECPQAFDHVGFFFEDLGTMVIGVVAWIVFVMGLIAGYLANTLVNNRGKGFSVDVLLGIVGAVIGGWIFSAAGATGVTGFNVWSLLVGAVGAVVFLVAWHVLRRSPRHA
jgi:uncharacterized membrane protein YeaQ/YmgE (transglycosylase-associated protein family)